MRSQESWWFCLFFLPTCHCPIDRATKPSTWLCCLKWYFLSLFWGKNWILGFESHETETFWSNNKDRNQWLHYLKVGDFHLNPFALKVFHLQTHSCGVWWNRIHLGLIIKHPCWWNIIIHPCWVRNWSKIPSASTKLPLGSRKKGRNSPCPDALICEAAESPLKKNSVPKIEDLQHQKWKMIKMINHHPGEDATWNTGSALSFKTNPSFIREECIW